MLPELRRRMDSLHPALQAMAIADALVEEYHKDVRAYLCY
jgi:hypothetical protein